MSRRLGGVAVLVCIALALTACSAQSSWFEPRTPTESIQASTPCPASVGKARDVRNPDAVSGRLLPDGEKASAGLICIYQGPLQPTQGVRQIVLDGDAAQRLASAVSQVSLQAPPAGGVNCPMDDGKFAIIALRFAGSTRSNLWWDMTGCQTLDNGTVGATQIANPSFEKFSDAIAALTR